MGLNVIPVKEQNVIQALGRGLKGDNRLSHEEVVDVIRATLDQGQITRQEMDDLRTIRDRSVTIPARSKKLIDDLLAEVGPAAAAPGAAFALPQAAGELVCDFLKRSGTGRFPHFTREEIGLGLLMRLHKPGLIDQGTSSLCGPASLLFNLATDKPEVYARFGIDLYEKGEGRIGKLHVEPGGDCRQANPSRTDIHPVDWMMTASIRDSENWLFDYQGTDDEFAGITMPGALEDWFEDAGYTDVRNVTNVVFSKGSGIIKEVNDLYAKGYRVCLFISANMLKAKKQTETTLTPDHWVVMRSPIVSGPKGVTLKVFSWGQGERVVPEQVNGGKPLSEADFLSNLYGYVAAKP